MLSVAGVVDGAVDDVDGAGKDAFIKYVVETEIMDERCKAMISA